MYLPTLSDDELLRYAGTLTLTPLESELVRRFTEFQDETGDKDAEIENQDDEIRGLAEKIEKLETELRESLA